VECQLGDISPVNFFAFNCPPLNFQERGAYVVFPARLSFKIAQVRFWRQVGERVDGGENIDE
jgi:hypothetical protein